MKSTPDGSGSQASQPAEVSIGATMIRTLTLVGLTFVFALVVRFVTPVAHGVQWVAGTQGWQEVYRLAGIESGLGREQAIMVAIMLVCFLLALAIQLFAMLLWRRWRSM